MSGRHDWIEARGAPRGRETEDHANRSGEAEGEQVNLGAEDEWNLDELGDDDAALAYLQRKVQVMRQADLVRQALLQDEKQMQINESGGG